MHTAEIKKWWPGSQPVKIKKYRGGAVNESYRVDTRDGTSILRIYRRKPLQQIKADIALLDYIKTLPVPNIMTYNGKMIFRIDGKYAIIYQYIPGRNLKIFNRRQLFQVGEFLAKFHAQGGGFRFSGAREKFYDFPTVKIKRVYNFCLAKKTPRPALLLQIKEEILDHQVSSKLPTGPIHVDVKPSNVLFEKGNLSGVIDFDNAYVGPWLLDLAKSMVWFGAQGKDFNIRTAREVYNGYVANRSLSPREQGELYQVVGFAFLSHIFMDFYMYVNGRTSKKYFDFITTNFYQVYQDFKKISPSHFYQLFNTYDR
ncbi:hypothetical protein A2477_03910 [Candidatus Falkowbacteria bacterium RIFOXYC2_FULL_47_12]|uniref:Aminoglycoside phosphotransferase domain-containing protein n=2 Tax=Candidatus Falkowiibacteriota TaxID=1752728 RepID=A0A1F5TP17_9BACT|nr:MAG: hypothetical protein A2242_04510 [Candidatus Falkowbacteria bacterium RIFOXYA2_FULL_47_9]OGF40620.1 MAG: hypothetical protein A2477_03910 [Candidatus Falkowbacteria bacterium RIFOXYC2_FULL_47_12]